MLEAIDDYNKSGKKSRDGSARYKTPKGEIYRRVALMIQRESTEHVNLAARFYITTPEVGSQVMIEEHEPGLVRVVNQTHIVAAVLKHLTRHLGAWKEYCLDVDGVKKAVAYWANYTPPVATPKVIAQKSDPELAFHRLPWDFGDVNGLTPFFDDFISRCSNSAALKAFLGSLFEPMSDRSQYVWLYGEGGDGKGTLTTMLYNIFGPVFCTPGVPGNGDGSRFWTIQMHKKRLAVISECEDSKFLQSAMFKLMTGDDAVSFERKGENAFSEKPTVKFLFSSNHHPQITRGRDHQRRLIYCAMSPSKIEVKDLISPIIMNANWWAEAPDIVAKCIAEYKKLCPTMGPIPSDPTSYQEAVNESETYYEALFWNYFQPVKGGKVSGAVMESILDERKLSFSSKRDFRNYIQRAHGIVKKKGGICNYWEGLTKRVITDRELF